MRILFIGDIFGQPGRRMVKDTLPLLRDELRPDLVLANGENAAAGFGITPTLVEELLDLDIAVLTSGNHIWDKKEIYPYLRDQVNGRLLRPANYPTGAPGHGLFVGKTPAGIGYAVINLQGRVFMPALDCPFRKADELLGSIPDDVKIRIVDFHAEATSEKQALGWYLDGRVTAVLGTHTHVPTADERVLPGGTAYQTDVGMSGPYDSIIGVEKELVLHKFLSGMPGKFEAAKGNPKMCAALVTCDPVTGRASRIQRIMLGE